MTPVAMQILMVEPIRLSKFARWHDDCPHVDYFG